MHTDQSKELDRILKEIKKLSLHLALMRRGRKPGTLPFRMEKTRYSIKYHLKALVKRLKALLRV